MWSASQWKAFIVIVSDVETKLVGTLMCIHTTHKNETNSVCTGTYTIKYKMLGSVKQVLICVMLEVRCNTGWGLDKVLSSQSAEVNEEMSTDLVYCFISLLF